MHLTHLDYQVVKNLEPIYRGRKSSYMPTGNMLLDDLKKVPGLARYADASIRASITKLSQADFGPIYRQTHEHTCYNRNGNCCCKASTKQGYMWWKSTDNHPEIKSWKKHEAAEQARAQEQLAQIDKDWDNLSHPFS